MIGLDTRARENQDQIHAVGRGRVKAGGQAAEPFSPTPVSIRTYAQSPPHSLLLGACLAFRVMEGAQH